MILGKVTSLELSYLWELYDEIGFWRARSTQDTRDKCNDYVKAKRDERKKFARRNRGIL